MTALIHTVDRDWATTLYRKDSPDPLSNVPEITRLYRCPFVVRATTQSVKLHERELLCELLRVSLVHSNVESATCPVLDPTLTDFTPTSVEHSARDLKRLVLHRAAWQPKTTLTWL